MKLIINTLFFLFILSPIGISCASNDKEKSSQISEQTAPTRKDLEAILHKQEIELLKQQNKLLNDGQSNLISVVVWSLGSTVTLGIFLVGYGWWSNFRLNEADKKQLKEEISRVVSDSESKIEINLEKMRAEVLSNVEERIEKRTTEISNNIKDIIPRWPG